MPKRPPEADELTLEAYLNAWTPITVALADKPPVRLEFDATAYSGGLYQGVLTSLQAVKDTDDAPEAGEAASTRILAQAIVHVARGWTLTAAPPTLAQLQRLGPVWCVIAWNEIVRAMNPKAVTSAILPSGSAVTANSDDNPGGTG